MFKFWNKMKTEFTLMQQIGTKKYMTWQNWVGMVIHWELCKRLKFDYTD